MKYQTLILALVILLFLFFKSSCWDEPCWRDVGTHETILARVYQSSLSKDTLFSSDTLRVYLSDTVGRKDCYTFNGLEVAKSTNQTDLKIWIKHDQYCGQTCKDSVTVMDGYVYNVFPPLSMGDNKIVIHQPDGSQLIENYFVHYLMNFRPQSRLSLGYQNLIK